MNSGWTPLPSTDHSRHYSLGGDLGSPDPTYSYDDYRYPQDNIPLRDTGRRVTMSPEQIPYPSLDRSFTDPEQQEPFPKSKKRRATNSSHKSHYSTYKDLHDQQSMFDFRRSRNVIFAKGFFEFGLTVALCGAIIGALKFWSGTDEGKPRLLGKKDTRLFNSLMIGLSLALGFNLASSLKSYVNILRWSLLGRQWYDLEAFELILGCASQTKLIELVIKAWPWPRFGILGKHKSKRIWVLGMSWLMINLGAQIAVAAMSLFWPVEPVGAGVGVIDQFGDVTVANFEEWAPNNREGKNITIYGQAAAANDYGRQAQDYQEMPYVSFNNETDSSETVYYDEDQKFWEYRFEDRSQSGTSRWSNRYVRSSATCHQYEVTSGMLHDCTNGNPPDETYGWDCFTFKYWDGQEWTRYFPPATWANGSTTYSSAYPDTDANTCKHDGRCVSVDVTQFPDVQNTELSDTIPAYIECNSSISAIHDFDTTTTDFTALPDGLRAQIYMSNRTAQLGAGAIGYFGNADRAWESIYYNSVLRWSPNGPITAAMMEKYVSRFAIGAVAALADHGPRVTVPAQSNSPLQAQQLEVDWRWVYILIGGINCVQLASLLLIMALANTTLIRDDSAWSLARLLMPVVAQLGPEAASMSGAQMIRAKVLDGERIAYGLKPTPEGNRVDVLWQSRGDQLKRTTFSPPVTAGFVPGSMWGTLRGGRGPRY